MRHMPCSGKPDDTAVDGLAARGGDELEVELADAEAEATIEGDVGDRLCPGAWSTPGFSAAISRARRPLTSNQMAAVRSRRCGDAGVVVLAGPVVGLGHVPGAGLSEQPDAADVVDMGLGGDDIRGGAGAHGVEDALVVRGLVAHARCSR